MPQSFKEFLDFSNPIDNVTRETISALSLAHPIFKNNATVQRILEDPSAAISISQLAQLNEAVLRRSYVLARKAGMAASSEQRELFLTVIEQNLLNTAAITLSTAVSARFQTSIDRLSKIAGMRG
jgi:hypothetical protein